MQKMHITHRKSVVAIFAITGQLFPKRKQLSNPEFPNSSETKEKVVN
jgi:hypothetical protein